MNMQPNDDDAEVYADNETGYNGLSVPVHIEEVDHTNGPAVVLGVLRQGAHVITADARGVLVVESAIPTNGKPHRA
jgi:hypothetical protein